MSFITDGGKYEWKISQTVNNVTTEYGRENFSEGTLADAMYEQISLGNVIARELDLRLWLPTGFDPSVPFELILEKTINGQTISIQKGVYYVESYEKSPYSDFADIVAYDALLKTAAPFMTTGEFTSIGAKELVDEIALRIGISVNQITSAYLLADPVTINEVPSIGDNGTTTREMLSVVASLYGGNFIINDSNELELICLDGTPESVDIVYIGTDGKHYVSNLLDMPSGASFTTVDSQGKFNATPKADIADSDVVVYISRDGNFALDTYGNIKDISPEYDTVTIGNEVVDFDVSPEETIKGVEIWAGSSTSYKAWDHNEYSEWNDVDGAVLVASMPIMASQSLADKLFARYKNFKYLPYTAQGVYAGPEVPLGTRLEIKDRTVVLSQRNQNVDLLCASDMSADETLGAVSYYPYLSPVERSIQKGVDENSANITILAGGAIVESVRSVSEKLKASQESQDAINKSVNEQLAEAKSIRQSLQNVANTHNGEILGLQSALTNQEGLLAVITNWLEANGSYVTTQQSYLIWDEIRAILAVGKRDAPVRTEMRSDAFAVVENGQDVFSASDAGSNARSFNAVEKVTIGNFKWVDEGNNGLSLM